MGLWKAGGMRDLPIVKLPHASCVRRVPIFSRLTVEQQDAVGSFARPVTLATGDLLHRAGESIGQLFVVHTGAVKLVHTTARGRLHLVRVAGPGEAVGEHEFLTGERSRHFVEAAETTRLCVFDHADLAQLVSTYPGISVGMLRSLSERVSDAERRLALSALEVPARVAGYLLDLPADIQAGSYQVTLPLPKKDIASWLATTPESLSRALKRLEQRRIIQVERDEITLVDVEALEELAAH